VLRFSRCRLAQQFERRIGGDQFHRRGRVHGLLGIVPDEGLLRVNALYDDGNTAQRDANFFSAKTTGVGNSAPCNAGGMLRKAIKISRQICQRDFNCRIMIR